MFPHSGTLLCRSTGCSRRRRTRLYSARRTDRTRRRCHHRPMDLLPLVVVLAIGGALGLLAGMAVGQSKAATRTAAAEARAAAAETRAAEAEARTAAAEARAAAAQERAAAAQEK